MGLHIQYLHGVPAWSTHLCVCVFLRASRRGLAKATLLPSHELSLSLSVRVSFVHAVGDKPPDAGM